MIEIPDPIAKQKVEKSFDFFILDHCIGFEKVFISTRKTGFMVWL